MACIIKVQKKKQVKEKPAFPEVAGNGSIHFKRRLSGSMYISNG